MKKILYLFILLLILASCKNNSAASQNKMTTDTKNLNNDTIQGIKTIKEFYLLRYGSDTLPNHSDRESLKRKFVSDRILNRIDSLNSDGENLIVDYDPFIQGQDYLGHVIRNTLIIRPLANKNEYRVSFLQFGEDQEKRIFVDVLLKKNENGDFLIYSILNDRYLNFNNNISPIENSSKYANIHDAEDTPNAYSDRINNKLEKYYGIWKTSCENGFAYLTIKKDTSFFAVMSNQIYIKVSLKKDTKKTNSYNIILIQPDDLGAGGILLDWSNFSRSIPIGYIFFLPSNMAEFKWLGFYNIVKKERIFTTSEFDLETNGNPVHLTLCK